MDLDDKEMVARVARARRLLAEARHVVALTGAGISTPSGIPDFRSPDSGLWRDVDPFQVASIDGFRRRPEAFYEWVRPLASTVRAAEPNPAHHALARLERHGPLTAVITQNIDGLHGRAGSRTVHEVHGHMRTAVCLDCGSDHPAAPLLEMYTVTGAAPRCPLCNGLLKPRAILFGELLPADVYRRAAAATRACDLMLVAGSSLTVAPVGDFPLEAKRLGARLIFVNLGPTPYDFLADVLIRADVADALPHLAAPFGPGADA